MLPLSKKHTNLINMPQYSINSVEFNSGCLHLLQLAMDEVSSLQGPETSGSNILSLQILYMNQVKS